MIKYKIIAECEDEFEQQAILDAVKNKLAIEEIYNTVFRPVIKYSQDKKKVKAFEQVWEELSAYLEGKDVKY